MPEAGCPCRDSLNDTRRRASLFGNARWKQELMIRWQKKAFEALSAESILCFRQKTLIPN